MYLPCDDILSRVADPPLWWVDGTPRFAPFRPEEVGVYVRETALVHIECQACATRFDVAVQPTGERPDLRSAIAFDNALPSDDPPNACPNSLGCLGASMGAMQIAVLEFWILEDVRRGWRRDPSWERPLVDSDWLGSGRAQPPEPVSRRIAGSDRADEWARARRTGDFEAMVGLLEAFGCERPAHVAHMLDRERRRSAWRTQMNALAQERLEPPRR